MTRRPDWIPARTAIPVAVQRAVFARSGGMCEREGCGKVGKELNHKRAVAFGGKNTPDNIELVCREHHAPETAEQTKRAVKADKQGGRLGQQKRRAEGKTQHIPNRSFDARFTRKLPTKAKPFGETVRREG